MDIDATTDFFSTWRYQVKIGVVFDVKRYYIYIQRKKC